MNAVILAVVLSGSTPITPLPDKVRSAVADRQDMQVPDRTRLTGWVGTRLEANERNRLARLDPGRLLEGYRKRPGRQAWDGEHVGKWLHAATLAWAYTGDPALRRRLDEVVAELGRCQLDDGYLGTYVDKDRWTEWDVWAHKYNLIGLITYMRYTGDTSPLPTCRRMADLLCRTFGDAPGQRDIIQAGEHVGLAPTSVLEPMALLYRLTGEQKYLDFCKYILRAWEQPNGPHVLSRLQTVKRVDKVGNGKAYELLSCLNGLLEVNRTTGEPALLEACLTAWQDVLDKRLYLTGTASYGELFHDDFDLPNTGNVGETCVTVTWLQLNAQLLRLTGQARFAEQLERIVLNQLFGAQRPDCAAWGYYVQMEGKKPYSDSLDGHCCLSSGPRGVALIPTFATTTDADGVVVNLYDAGTSHLTLRDGTAVTLTAQTRFPQDGSVRLTVDPSAAGPFTVKVRRPAWSTRTSILVNGEAIEPPTTPEGYAAVKRIWKKGDTLEVRMTLGPKVVAGDHKNQGKAAVIYGPLVLAADEALLGGQGRSLQAVGLPSTDAAALDVTPEPAPDRYRTWPGAQVFRVKALARRALDGVAAGAPVEIRMVPFADAGAGGSAYRVWLPVGRNTRGNVLLDGQEGRSRPGNVTGSINDDEAGSFVVTFDNRPAKEDWFAVTLDQPVSIGRVVYVHGKTFHDGGWFDTRAGKPKVQVRIKGRDDWQTVGELTGYPATTAADAAGLTSGEAFSCPLARPVEAVAVRVVGVPASGDNPRQAFSSCAELQGFPQ